MALELVTNPHLDWVRTLSPAEERALRAVKAGEADEEQQAVCLAMLNAARDEKRWILCDCQEEEGQQAVIVPVRRTRRHFALSNRPDTQEPHAEDCVFARGKAGGGGGGRSSVFDDMFDPFTDGGRLAGEPAPAAADRWGFEGLAPGRQPRTLSGMLGALMDAARLNALAVADGFSSERQWLAEIAHAAEAFRLAPGVPMPAFLFTDPADWRLGAVARRLAAAESNWPERHRPFALLCWTAREVDETAINRSWPRLGHVEVRSKVTAPSVWQNRVPGPWLFLGLVARSEDRRQWECLSASAQPIVSTLCPVPVDSHSERRALGTLRRLAQGLEADPGLRHALGGAVRAELEKPLFRFETAGGPCLPDFLLTITRPGGGGHMPGNPGPRRTDGRYDAGGILRYVIEVMGFDDAEYESGKADMHARMHTLGRLFRMEAPLFDSRHNPLRRQREEIGADIRSDIMRRWGRK
ncbi:MAG: hypothetical protein OXG99_09540 [Alphaproteobacteria bacterium]|nr:hypothetical protein [Alphaproteobacteria bacterium]